MDSGKWKIPFTNEKYKFEMRFPIYELVSHFPIQPVVGTFGRAQKAATD